jgi:hypothetical protein
LIRLHERPVLCTNYDRKSPARIQSRTRYRFFKPLGAEHRLFFHRLFRGFILYYIKNWLISPSCTPSTIHPLRRPTRPTGLTLPSGTEVVLLRGSSLGTLSLSVILLSRTKISERPPKSPDLLLLSVNSTVSSVWVMTPYPSTTLSHPFTTC